MTLKINRNGVQIEAYSPNGGWGSFPLLGVVRPWWSLKRIPGTIRAAHAWQARGEIAR